MAQHALPLQLVRAEVEQQTNRQTGRLKIAEKLCFFKRRHLMDRLYLYVDLIKNQKIGDVSTIQMNSLVNNLNFLL